MSKRNITYIKPQDPEFLRLLKKQAGYDDRNHKFDVLQNAEEDFIDDTDNEQPQVVVLNPGDLTAEEAEIEKQKIDKNESEAKADLSVKPQFYPKSKKQDEKMVNKKRRKVDDVKENKKAKQLLSFDIDDDGDSS